MDFPAKSILTLEVPLPSLILLGSGQKYYLWATLDKTITQASKICAAPFPNLDENGSICLGGNVVPECRVETMKAFGR